jgi:type I restriction enzyme S subunit
MSWVTTKLEDIATLMGGGTPSRSNKDHFGTFIDWVTPTDLPPIGNVNVLGQVREGLSETGLKNSSANRIPADSVLFSSRASIGKIAVTDRECATNQGFANFVPKKDVVDTWFLAYLLCSVTPDITRLAGETTFKEVSRGKLREFTVRIPDTLKEQRRIVGKIKELMERVDEITALQEEARVEAEYLDTVLFGELELATNFPRVRIEELISDSQNGRSISKTDRDANGAVLTLTAVSDVYLNWSFIKPIQVEAKVAEQFAISEGDVFVSRSNTRALVGLSAVATQSSPQGTIYPDLLIKLTADRSRIRPEYLAFALRFPSVRDQIRSHAKGTSQSMVKISGATLREIVVPVPDTISEQERILGVLRNRHNRAKAIQSCVGEIPGNHLRNAILRKAFAGEL